MELSFTPTLYNQAKAEYKLDVLNNEDKGIEKPDEMKIKGIWIKPKYFNINPNNNQINIKIVNPVGQVTIHDINISLTTRYYEDDLEDLESAINNDLIAKGVISSGGIMFSYWTTSNQWKLFNQDPLNDGYDVTVTFSGNTRRLFGYECDLDDSEATNQIFIADGSTYTIYERAQLITNSFYFLWNNEAKGKLFVNKQQHLYTFKVFSKRYNDYYRTDDINAIVKYSKNKNIIKVFDQYGEEVEFLDHFTLICEVE